MFASYSYVRREGSASVTEFFTKTSWIVYYICFFKNLREWKVCYNSSTRVKRANTEAFVDRRNLPMSMGKPCELKDGRDWHFSESKQERHVGENWSRLLVAVAML